MNESLAVRIGVALLCAGLVVFACSPTPPEQVAPDAGTPIKDAGAGADGGSSDAGPVDAGHQHPPLDAGTPLTGPDKLSETGLYSDFAARTLAPGVIPFTPRYELWSDGAEKRRWIQLPPGTQIDTSDMDNWVFPVGTRSWKEFTRDGKLVETRLLWKKEPGPKGWFEMAYLWNEDGTEAIAAPEGQVNANGTEHDVPSQMGCNTCHVGVRDVLIGPSAVQLSSADGNGQLSQWADAGWLSHPPAAEFEVPGDAGVQAALGYLHGNCSHCHRSGNALATKRTLRLAVTTTDTAPEQTGAYTTTFNVKAYHEFEGTLQLVVPGDPDLSQLYRRVLIRDATSVNESFGYQMPPTCTEKPDVVGNETIRAWIEQL